MMPARCVADSTIYVNLSRYIFYCCDKMKSAKCILSMNKKRYAFSLNANISRPVFFSRRANQIAITA
jgi:hypothetical protein